MEMLWTKDLKTNTVHVRDVAKALWFLTTNGNNGQIFNLCDENDTGECEPLAVEYESSCINLLCDRSRQDERNVGTNLRH